MFGEYADDVAPAAAPQGNGSAPEPESLQRLIALHLAAHSEVVVKSQQRGEPELSSDEKVDIAITLMDGSPSQFLYRFDRYLKLEHLAYFEAVASEDPIVAHYLTEARHKLDTKKAKVRIRNRRWAAVQQMNGAGSAARERSEDYFSEPEMKRRNPLLYQELVGRHLTEQEKQDIKGDYDRSDCRMTTIIFDHMDRCEERTLQKQQEELEDDMFEEEEDEDEDEEAMDEGEADLGHLDPGHRALLKDEFVSSMHNTFVMGKDDSFDYKCVDNNEDYDLLDVEGHDKEEQYFDDEEPCDASSDRSSVSSPMLLQPCLDRRLLGRAVGPERRCSSSPGVETVDGQTTQQKEINEEMPAVQLLFIK